MIIVEGEFRDCKLIYLWELSILYDSTQRYLQSDERQKNFHRNTPPSDQTK